jgi:diketogulonate reductase-like aldo/keto reductase
VKHYARWRKTQPPAYRQRKAAEVEAMRKARAGGMILTDIAELFGCSESTVERAVKGKTFPAPPEQPSPTTKIPPAL